ncbi:unnamed protein product [Owenia fusiformis]|uniref:Ubiquitin carboxyl-terminal hydrolase n=1 Tax=Owenia fusiformis TaxID=6347 RepID=A0A8S4NZN6_OWEFU|nr:unnamed protein product [Owenia fusiformis]
MDGKNDSQSPSKNETIKASNMNENGANDEEKNVMPMELSDTESARAASTAGSADTSSTPEDSRSPTMEVEPQSSVPASIPNENVIQLELPEPGLAPPEPVTNPDVSPPEPVTNPDVSPPEPVTNSDLTLPQPVKDSTSQESKNQSDIKIEDENIDCEKKKTGAFDSKAAAVVEGAAAPSSSSIDDKAPIQSVYHVKWITFKGKNLPIITQNENGPCPLLAIMNVLLLSEKICLPAMIEMVTSGQLMEYLGDCIFEQAPKNIAEDAQLNYEQNMHDAMAVFHKLQTGLDVNVKFTGCSDFEYTSECIVFDLLAIHLYHGWQVDPDQLEVVAAVGGCSYNQLVEKIIAQKSSEKPELVTEALIAETFLEKSASQLTYHGLSELVTTVKENELCVFFRNNHFSTLYKHKESIYDYSAATISGEKWSGKECPFKAFLEILNHGNCHWSALTKNNLILNLS